MRGIIWYWENREEAQELLEEMVEEYKYMDVKLSPFRSAYRQTKDSLTAEFENGDKWDVFRATDCRRGHKCNISYISRLIPEEVVNVIIMPCTTGYPYHAINYWYEEPVAVPNANGESVTR